MASVAFGAWDRIGRPLEPSRPVRDIVGRMKVAYPEHAEFFSWYADDAHYEAVPPMDHTPFSATGWPLPSPRWVVFATDIMAFAVGGEEALDALFRYWLAEAKAGRMPWLKYMIWRGKRYDVRNNWASVPASGHFDHVHMSIRTDHQDTSLGTWILIPTEDDMADAYYRLTSTDPKYNGKVFVSNRVHRRGPLRNPGGIQGPATAGATEVILTDAMRGADTWDAYLDAVAGPLFPGSIPVDVDEEEIAEAVAEAIDVPTAAETAEAVADELHERTAD